MSYELLQFNLGTGKAQGFVLAGRGEHLGTNVSLTVAEMDTLIWRAQQEAKMRAGYRPAVRSLLKGESKASPQERDALAEALDRLLLRAHADRNAPPPLKEPDNG